MQEGKRNEVLADLHCACTMCTDSKTRAPSLRKSEGTRTHMSSSTGYHLLPRTWAYEYRESLISTDPYFSDAMDALKKLDEIEQIP